MNTLATVPTTLNLREPIPGYVLRDRIGAGGYGEVWRADAPGGLAKAVKIVYGPLKAGRADRELKALNRIKQVQHPLLLSLERIEMVGEHLIIVMELAHGSLKQRYDTCIAEGGRGIPRGELLAYLRDVADALDFLYEKHSLQHLDVKPENLLLIANRVKVADFGLIKDLGDRSESLVSGLTPLYAPPEVFDGRPNRNSDQYSLALVYQELLTGEPAFSGRTVAQLAAQHLHSSPCLASLAKTDQSVIARALSKDPDRRFPSCRALIDSLMDAPRASHRIRRSVTETTRITPAADSPVRARDTIQLGETRLTYPVASEVRRLPALDLPADSSTLCRPAVFIGVGGTGARVLRSLRCRLYERFGSVDEIPSLQMLLLDTDATALHRASRGDHGSGLRPRELVSLTLRQPQDYRSDAHTLLEWLNRRWLFNIPRSLTTEGIRPLGRLAMVDHFDAIASVVHHAISSVISEESLASSCRTTGLDFLNAPPRIFVVASMAGGLGSGLALDLGYLIRTMLEELHIPDEQLHGVLVHATSRRTNQRDLALANSLSLLTELHHYTSASGYPGEPACKLPPRVGDSAPFRHTYITHLGDELSDDEFAEGTTRLGEYLYQNSVTSAAAFFDHCRQSAHESNPKARGDSARCATVRSLGLACVGGTNDAFVDQQANSLCQTVAARWSGHQQTRTAALTTPSPDPEMMNLVRKFTHSMDLRFDKLIVLIRGLVERQLGDAGSAYFERRIARLLETSHGGEERERLEQVNAALETELYVSNNRDESLRDRVRAKVATIAAAKRETFRDWLSILVDAPKSRVEGARDVVRWYQNVLEELEAQTQHAIRELDDPNNGTACDDDRQILLHYALTELQRISLDAVSYLIREVKVELLQCEELFREFSRRILHLRNEFDDPGQDGSEADSELVRLLKEQHLELTEQLDRELAPVLLRKRMSPSALLTANSDVWTQLVGTMRTAAQRLASNAVRRLQVSSVIRGEGKRFGDGPATAAETVRAATPQLLECGGVCRFLLVAPQTVSTWPEDWKQPFEEVAGASASVVVGEDDAIVVCCESQSVPLQNVATRLVGTRRDLLKVAGRLHTRIDVEWPVLDRWLSHKGD